MDDSISTPSNSTPISVPVSETNPMKLAVGLMDIINSQDEISETTVRKSVGYFATLLSKTLNVDLSPDDINTLVGTAKRVLGLTTKPKISDDGECLDEASVLDLISRIKKGEVDKEDAITTVKTELKRQCRNRALAERNTTDLWEQIKNEERSIETAKNRVDAYRESPSINDDGRFDQYFSDLRAIARLRKSVQEKKLAAHKEIKDPSPSIARLEELLLTLL